VPLFRPTVRRWIGAVCAVLMFILLAGATYQGVATALERREFPRPGGLVSVGDHQLHIYCTGKGSPTVVLEAPAAGMSAAWGEVQRRLSATTHVCSYDRTGLGWSETGDRPFDPSRVPVELQTLLTRASERGPFVVAGHGLGAEFARMYAARPDSHTAALVLIDPPPTAQPWKIVACLKNRMLKKPRRPKFGRQIQRWIDQLVRGRLSGVQRRPISMTATR